jgi:hypothetical protein
MSEAASTTNMHDGNNYTQELAALHPTSSTARACQVPVVYVQKQNAKTAKQYLVDQNLLDTRFRMVPAADDISTRSSCIAIPVLLNETDVKMFETISWWKDLIEGMGAQICPYSTKMLGNHKRLQTDEATTNCVTNLSLAQLVLLDGMERNENAEIFHHIKNLDPHFCPKHSLQVFGDDRTIVLPPTAFLDGTLLTDVLTKVRKAKHGNHSPSTTVQLEQDFWSRLAAAHDSSRVVRKGTVDPNSKIRHSGHRLVWPHQGIPETTGPNAPGWICVTENGIKQSFDLTRVMFSRGNISEKIRFGRLVQEGEMVLDLYAGIGYYTLPALVHGKASFVYACEWNPDAVTALQCNVHDNKVSDRVQIFQGDCRQVASENNLVGIADRVSLGLLPSSEGGWRTAIKALKDDTGGWLHIHGNVPGKEKDAWVMWVCRQLYNMTKEEKKEHDNWQVLCNHVEKVKSFAPTVFHYVADVFVGPGTAGSVVVVVQGDGTFLHCPEDIQPPSCALSEDGVLHQKWMR